MLCLQQHVLKQIIAGIIRCDLMKLVVVILRFLDIARTNGKLSQLEQDPLADRSALQCHDQKASGLIQPVILFEDSRCHRQKVGISDPLPFDGFGDPQGCLVVLLIDQLLHLFDF